MRRATSWVWIVGLASACEARVEQPLRVVLPEDRSTLSSVDNASLVLLPDGELNTFSVEGIDFSLEIDLPESGGPFAVELYLAAGTELVAWGRSAAFSVGAPSPAIFVGAPGALSTFPRVVDDPDPSVLASLIGEDGALGALLLDESGDTFFFSVASLETQALSKLAEADAFTGGALARTLEGDALRVSWGPAPRAALFTIADSRWHELSLDAEATAQLQALDPRAPFAASVATHGSLDILGDGSLTLIDLSFAGEPDDAALTVSTLATPSATGGPRLGGSFMRSADGLTYFAFGGENAASLAWFEPDGAVGSPSSWIGAACVEIGSVPGSEFQFVCGGGQRDGVATSDLVAFRPAAQGWEHQEFPGALGAPMRAPLMWVDETALYAQSDGRLRAFPAAKLDDPSTSEGAAQRHREGVFFQLSTGATFLVGGVSASGAPLTRWQVFTPALTP